MATTLFPGQQPNETIYVVLREHWFHFFFKVLVWVFFGLLIVLFNIFGRNYLPGLFEDAAGQVTQLFTQVAVLVLALSLFLIWVFYYLNIQIITSLRLVDITQAGLFSHTISELHIDKIEDVTSETNGIFGTIFDYGNVYVQTAAAVERFEFLNVPNPAAVEKLLLDLYEKNSNFAKDAAAENPPTP